MKISITHLFLFVERLATLKELRYTSKIALPGVGKHSGVEIHLIRDAKISSLG